MSATFVKKISILAKKNQGYVTFCIPLHLTLNKYKTNFVFYKKVQLESTKNISHSVYFSSKLNHLAVVNTRVANLERSHFLHGNTAIGYAQK